MSGSILNNVGALTASRQLGITGQGLQKTIERLSTGKRINRASDDAAGLAISNQLGSDVRIANQGKRNANDGISYLQVADGVLEEVTNLLNRAAELSQQSKTGTVDTTGRVAIDAEYQNIVKTLADMNTNTKFNGTAVYGSTLTIAVGGFSDVVVSVGSIAALSGDLLTSATASTAEGLIAGILTSVSALRGSIGAGQQQLTSISNSLGIQVENFTAAYSQIRDANVADEVVNLNKFQILNQSGTSALQKANQAAQSILTLLQ